MCIFHGYGFHVTMFFYHVSYRVQLSVHVSQIYSVFLNLELNVYVHQILL